MHLPEIFYLRKCCLIISYKPKDNKLHCNTAALSIISITIYRNSTQCTTPQPEIKITSLYNSNAEVMVVGAKTVFERCNL